MFDKIPVIIGEIEETISRNGGKAYLVGGCVRDEYLKIAPKDLDIEVFNLKQDKLISILKSLASRIDLVGKSFGVIKIKIDDLDLDISIPRKEIKIADGHKGFDIECDPFLSIEEAVSRRDFSINGLMWDICGRKLVDVCNGVFDLDHRILRPISEKFKEDPLRILRGVQFAARFNLILDKTFIQYAYDTIDSYQELPKERIWCEWEKFISKSVYPLAGIRALKQSGWDKYYEYIFDVYSGSELRGDYKSECVLSKYARTVIYDSSIVIESLFFRKN